MADSKPAPEDYDLTQKLAKFLDPHMLIPLINHLASKNMHKNEKSPCKKQGMRWNKIPFAKKIQWVLECFWVDVWD